MSDLEHSHFIYSSWLWIALHVILTIPKYRTITDIVERLNIRPEVVVAELKELEKRGLASEGKNGKWTTHLGDLHIGQDSFMLPVHHQNWRNRALLELSFPKPDNIHFSNVFSISENDFQKLKELTLEYIDRQKNIIAPSPEEDIACITIDFFKL